MTLPPVSKLKILLCALILCAVALALSIYSARTKPHDECAKVDCVYAPVAAIQAVVQEAYATGLARGSQSCKLHAKEWT